MRTSHVAIKRMVADEKNRLTDEQLFGSPQFAAYLTDIAEGATKRYRRSSKVSTYWDTSESADIAHTDNRIIRLNAGNFLTGSFPAKSLKADSLIGIVAHECGHILYSDFTMLATYQQALSAGRFYPATPEELTARQEKSLQEILDNSPAYTNLDMNDDGLEQHWHPWRIKMLRSLPPSPISPTPW